QHDCCQSYQTIHFGSVQYLLLGQNQGNREPKHIESILAFQQELDHEVVASILQQFFDLCSTQAKLNRGQRTVEELKQPLHESILAFQQALDNKLVASILQQFFDFCATQAKLNRGQRTVEVLKQPLHESILAFQQELDHEVVASILQQFFDLCST